MVLSCVSSCPSLIKCVHVCVVFQHCTVPFGKYLISVKFCILTTSRHLLDKTAPYLIQLIMFTNICLQEDMAERSACLDAERIEVACLRQDIIDEYEKKSAELLDYLNSMETAFEQQRAEYEQRECCLKQKNKELKKLLELEHKSQCRLREERERRACELEQELQEARDQQRKTERCLAKHQRTAEVDLLPCIHCDACETHVEMS